MVERSDKVVDEVESAGQGMSWHGTEHIARGMVGSVRGVEGGAWEVQADAGGLNEMRPVA
jgi:hypothetical protein